jgi:hypothetical protein
VFAARLPGKRQNTPHCQKCHCDEKWNNPNPEETSPVARGRIVAAKTFDLLDQFLASTYLNSTPQKQRL